MGKNKRETPPKGFDWNCQTAKREKKTGRAREGIIRIKEGWERIEETKETDGLVDRKVKIGKEKWNIYTAYSNKELGRLATKPGEKLGQAKKGVVIIGGDINARIGREGMLYNGNREEKQGRKNSKDKIKNGEGVKMLQMVTEQGWHILNGEYTYVEKRGESVIDYVVTNTVGIDKVLNFRVMIG